MRPTTGAPILISREAASTRPGATAAHCFWPAASARARFLRAQRRRELGEHRRADREANQERKDMRLAGVSMRFTSPCVLFRRTWNGPLLADDASVLDADDPIGERQYTRVVSDDQDGARRGLSRSPPAPS